MPDRTPKIDIRAYAGGEIPAEVSRPVTVKLNPKYGILEQGDYGSKAESRRHGDLQAMEAVGEIHHVVHHPFRLYLGKNDKNREISYRPDFFYMEGDCLIIEEVKGPRVRDWPPRAALVKQVWGFLFELRTVEG